MFNFLSIFKKLGKLVVKGLGHAKDLGLNDALMEKALALVKVAAQKPTSNADKREWVVAALQAAGVPTPLARLLCELAVISFKAIK